MRQCVAERLRKVVYRMSTQKCAVINGEPEALPTRVAYRFQVETQYDSSERAACFSLRGDSAQAKACGSLLRLYLGQNQWSSLPCA
jgi:hypothetical protein